MIYKLYGSYAYHYGLYSWHIQYTGKWWKTPSTAIDNTPREYSIRHASMTHFSHRTINITSLNTAGSLSLHCDIIQALWHLKSLATRLFVQQLVQVDITENKAPHYWSLCEGNPPVNGGFPSQRAIYAKNVSSSWYHPYIVANYKAIFHSLW